ncbi:hypothetical protein J2S09_003907 [Bacillus fengqiuensis]|nr:hypothetical protein [Bacillus fengqiuensis]
MNKKWMMYMLLIMPWFSVFKLGKFSFKLTIYSLIH